MRNPEAERYLGMIGNFFPRHMTQEKCRQGVWGCFQSLYAWRSICHCLLLHPTSYVVQGLSRNVAANRHLDPVDFF